MYHSDQGWSFAGDLGIGGRDFRVGVGFALSNQDDLIEEYDGWTLRFESRKVGSERVGLSLGLSWYWPDWQEETLFALAARPHLPRAYEQRTTIEPAMAFALTRNVVVAGGISVTDLESLAPPHASSMASAAIFSVAYDQRWEAGKGAQHRLSGNVGLRAATDALDTDLHYTRYFGEARYRFTHRRQTVLASGMFGHITGDAPMFERFSLGNSTTLRGWDKFDILPAGGDEMAHGSVEYRNRGFAVFFDAGSVWERETEAKMRLSTGFGFHIDNFFMTLGFPLNADELRTMFMIGVRF
jgi:hypothetical protein